MRHYAIYYCTNLSNATCWRRKLEATLLERKVLFYFVPRCSITRYIITTLSNACRRGKLEASTLLEQKAIFASFVSRCVITRYIIPQRRRTQRRRREPRGGNTVLQRDYREIRSFQYRAAVFPHRLHSMGNKSCECLPTYRRARSNLIWYVHRYAHTYAHGFVRRSRVRAGNMRRRDTVCQRRSGTNGGSSTGEERTNDTRRACLCAPGAKIPRCLLCHPRRCPNRVRLLSGRPLLTDNGEEHRLLRKTARSPSRTAFGRFANTNVCLRVVRFDLLNKQDAGDRSVASYESHVLVYRANTRKYSARYFRWRPQTGGKLLRACFSCTHCRALSF